MTYEYIKAVKKNNLNKYGNEFIVGESYESETGIYFVKKDEVRALIDFFSSPTNLKFLAVKPLAPINTIESSRGSYTSKKIEVLKELTIEEVKKNDKTGQIAAWLYIFNEE